MKPSDDILHIDDGDRGPSIRLADGSRFFLLHPDPALLDPWVIGHSLSKLCRFTGHTTPFYSVAQHCVMVSKIVPRDLAEAGLLHDASEAFIGDLSRPLKVLFESLAPGVVSSIEDRLHAAIAERFDFDFPHHPDVKQADHIAVATEIRDLLAPSPDALCGLPDPLPDPIEALPPLLAYQNFMARFRELQ